MKISEISIAGFRSHLDTKVAGLAKFNLFLGPNGSGKSSILDAVSFALTGTCRGTDEAGRGADTLVSQDKNGAVKAATASVKLLTDKGEIARAVGMGPKSSVQSSATRLIGVPITIVKNLVQTGSFLRLDPTDQKALLMGLVDAKLSVDDVKSAISQEDMTTLGLQYGQLSSPGDLDALEKRLREWRPTLKTYLAQHLVPTVAEPEGLPAGDRAALRDKCRQQLNSLREKKEGLRATAAAAEQAKKTVADADANLSALDDKIKEFPVDKLRASITALEAEANKARAAEAKTVERLATLTDKKENLLGAIASLHEQITRTESIKGGACPTCLRGLSKSDAKAISDPLKKQLTEREKEISKVQSEIDKAQELPMGDRPLQAILDDLRDMQMTLNEAATAQEQRNKWAGLRESAMKTNPPAEGANVAELEQRIVKGEALVSALDAYLSAVNVAGQVAVSRKEAEVKLEACERAIDALGPKGPLRAKLLKGGLSDFMAGIADLGAGLGLLGVSIQIEPWQIRANNRGANLLSASEEWRLGAVISAMVARASKAGVLCLDGVEVLDDERRRMLSGLMSRTGLDQALMAATPSKPLPGKPSLSDWAFYFVSKNADGFSQVA